MAAEGVLGAGGAGGLTEPAVTGGHRGRSRGVEPEDTRIINTKLLKITAQD